MVERRTFPLRMLGWGTDGDWKMICIDTDIAVVGRSEEEAHAKMKDATLLYLRSFEPEAILNGDFRRRAPLKYFLQWYLGRTLHTLIPSIRSQQATYDSRGDLSFA